MSATNREPGTFSISTGGSQEASGNCVESLIMPPRTIYGMLIGLTSNRRMEAIRDPVFRNEKLQTPQFGNLLSASELRRALNLAP
jgi:hypothetical protein